MAKLQLPPGAKYAIGIAVAVIVWSVIGVGIGLVEMYNTGGTQATGTFTFSGNVTSAQWVNITSANTIYTLEFNATRNALGQLAECTITNCIVVNLTIGFNGSYSASGNLTNVINNVDGYGNTSLASLVTATNTSQRTTITADTAGTAGNSITLSDTSANIASSAMSGGTAPNAAPSYVMTVAQLAVAVFASLGVMIRFIE